MPAELKASRHDASLVLTITNPGADNSLHPEIYAAAIETLSTAERGSSVRTVILTGSGHMFCSGNKRTNDGSGKTKALDDLASLQGWIEAILDCPKPVILAVEGLASGAGFALALASDFVVAGKSAMFSMPSVKAALTPDTGLWLLANMLPRQTAAEILMSGEAITAARMHQLGVVNRLTEDGEALNAALSWADELAALPSDVIERIKGMLHDAPMHPMTHYMDIEKQNFMECLHWRHSRENS